MTTFRSQLTMNHKAVDQLMNGRESDEAPLFLKGVVPRSSRIDLAPIPGDRGYDAPELDPDNDCRGPEAERPLVPLGWGRLGWSALMEPVPPVDWLVEGVVPRGNLLAVAGYSGSFKSWCVADIALAVASGGEFLDRFGVVPLPDR